MKSDSFTSDAPLFAHAGVSVLPPKHDPSTRTEGPYTEGPRTVGTKETEGTKETTTKIGIERGAVQATPKKAENHTAAHEPSKVPPPHVPHGTPATLETVNKADLPPMMQRYVEYKATYPDAILFFQVGDFFELFFEDAVTVSKALNLTLTSRDKNNPNPIPMCGVPLSVLDSYVDRLLPLGFAVAVVTQTGSGSGVDRTLERFVTPGMRLFSSVNTDSSESIISAVSIDSDGRSSALAYCDPQTGEILVKDTIEISHLPRELDALHARECIVPRIVQGEKIDRRTAWVKKLEIVVGAQSLRFRPEPLATTSSLPGVTPSGSEGFLTLGTCAKRAVRQLLAYLDEISLGNIVPVRSVSLSRESGMMLLDAHTRRNLELVQNSKDGSLTGTLFEFINRTSTPGGARQLRNWLLHPLCTLVEITKRQDAVEALQLFCDDLTRLLSGLSDVERLAARVELGIASPRDLASLRDVLERLPQIQESLSQAREKSASELLVSISKGLVAPDAILQQLSSALVDSPPPTLQDGGVIRSGYDNELDEIRAIRSTADEWRAAFEAAQRAATGVTSLKVKSNNVIGFFIEVPTAHSAKMPQHFQRRQSTANADRFTTPELREHEQSVITAVDRQVRRENLLFIELRKELQSHNDLLRGIARSLADLDALNALAVTASKSGLVRPTVLEEPVLTIEKGWHPVIATLLEGRFVPNSVDFAHDGTRCYLVTGPNMGGKSTYLRQTALIVVLAQMGAFVPAKQATVGISDKVFARLGASDDLHEGESTFMVEMREAAHILSSASRSSLVLIDELGRGTATSDGLSLAQAILEEICTHIQCRTLFATHYHELTVLEGKGLPVGNLSVGSIEEDTRVIFTHEIQSGPAPRSYGLEVAKLSGLPSHVLERAEDLLDAAQISEKSRSELVRGVIQDAPLRPRAPKIDPSIVSIVSKIKNMDPNSLSPREALASLFELCEQAQKIHVENGA